MMKFYNITAGTQLKRCGAGILRKHSAPDRARFEAYVSLDPGLGRLAQSSAEYCLAEEEEVSHFGLGAAAYCHATSPIRRYADLMNQRILKQLIRGNKEGLFVTVPVADLNLRAKAAKTFEKNLHYLRALLEGPKEVEGLILEVSDTKIRLWIPSWQRIVSIRPEPDRILAVGQVGRIRFAIHLLGRHWKERIITKVC
jgi:exoribonuclease R